MSFDPCICVLPTGINGDILLYVKKIHFTNSNFFTEYTVNKVDALILDYADWKYHIKFGDIRQDVNIWHIDYMEDF